MSKRSKLLNLRLVRYTSCIVGREADLLYPNVGHQLVSFTSAKSVIGYLTANPNTNSDC